MLQRSYDPKSMNSKYQRWYNDIVLRGKTRVLDCYRERHHILPRSLGGDDYEENIVDLTYREHFLVHWLLTKIYEGQARRAMVYALHCMTWSLNGRIVSGWQFEVAKRAVKAEVFKRAKIRRMGWESRRKTYVQSIKNRRVWAEIDSQKLNPASSKHRQRLSIMTREWLAGDQNRLRQRMRPWKRHPWKLA